MWLRKKKKLKSLIRFHSANKIDNYNRQGRKRRGEESKTLYRTSQNIRILYVFLESLLPESFPSLEVTVHLTSLGCPPTLCSSLDLLWGQFRFYSGPTPVCSCLQCPQLSELTCRGGNKTTVEIQGAVWLMKTQNLPTSYTSCRLNPRAQLGRLCVYGIYKRTLRAPTKENALAVIAVDTGGKNTQE